uniref:Uncharacterized protein n=1 Tax=Rhizophora mucronata TaxID=61149 RepID=A0A2P2Q4X8_RHIMU
MYGGCWLLQNVGKWMYKTLFNHNCFPPRTIDSEINSTRDKFTCLTFVSA